MKGIFHQKIWQRLLLILLILVSVPVFVLGFIHMQTSKKAVRESILQSYNQIAIRSASEIGLFINHSMAVLDTTAEMFGLLSGEPRKQEAILIEAVVNNDIFSRIALTDIYGKEIANSDMEDRFLKRGKEEAFVEARNGNFYISDVYIAPSSIPHIEIAIPVKNMGYIVGALIAEVDLRGVWDIVDKIKVGETGSAYLVSKKGVLIAHPDKRKVLRNEKIDREEAVSLVLSGISGSLEYADKNGAGWLASYAPVERVGWGVVFRQSAKEAYSIFATMRYQSLITIILAEIAAVIVSIFLSIMMVKPLKSLVHYTRRIAAGEMDYRLSTRRKDEIGELIRSFNDMVEKLNKAKIEEKFLAVGSAASAMAHELKNSFVPLKSFIGLLPYRHKDEDFIKRFGKIVPQELDRCERLLEDISACAKPIKIEKEEVEIESLVAEVLDLMEYRFSSHNIKVEINIVDAGIIRADEPKLRQVFLNLISNAVDVMPDGGLLTISAKPSQECIEVSFKDTGTGVLQDTKERIFEPFQSTKRGGLGLGLAISRRVIEEHGGNIDVESSAGEGTVFVVKLPR